jgi:polyhydroxyalkanoate synthase
VKGNELRDGWFELDGRRIELSAIEAPVLIFGGRTDGIAPIPCVRAGAPLLTGSREVRFEQVPGGHLGMLTGRRARGTTWRILDEWMDRWASDSARTKQSSKASARPAPQAASRDAIGSNPTRRYGSGGSRSLAR